MEIRRMAARKPTIVKPQLDQPPYEDLFHQTAAPIQIIGARAWASIM
jgi:hypothetical protein